MAAVDILVMDMDEVYSFVGTLVDVVETLEGVGN
jgi:hypothetical protein